MWVHHDSVTLFPARHDAMDSLPEPRLTLRFGTSRPAPPRGLDLTSSRFHFFIGSDPAHWGRNARAFRSIQLHDTESGIDVVLRFDERGLVYDLVADPGERVDLLRVHCSPGWTAVTGAGASVEFRNGGLVLLQRAATTFESSSLGERTVARADVRVHGPNEVGFALPAAGERATVVDPGLEWSTYLGGSVPNPNVSASTLEIPFRSFLTPQREPVVVSNAVTLDFPSTPGAFETSVGPNGAIAVSRFSADGSQLLFSTFVGSGAAPLGVDACVTPSGSTLITGGASKTNFPITPGAYWPSSSHHVANFLLELSSAGSSLVYSTFILPSSASFHGTSAVADASTGTVWLTGHTTTNGLPVTPNAVQSGLPVPFKGGSFVLRMDNYGTALGYCSYLGASEDTTINNVVPLSGGRVLVAGSTQAADYPVTPGAVLDAAPYSVVLSIIDPALGLFEASTYFGGLQGIEGLAKTIVVPDGSIYLCGRTTSTDFPVTPGAFDKVNGLTAFGGFVAKLNSSLSAIQYATYLGSDTTLVNSIAVDPSGAVTVGGETSDGGFPTTTGCYQKAMNGGFWGDFFVTRLSHDLRGLYYSTFLGGSYLEGVVGEGSFTISVDSSTGSVVGAGRTISTDYPVTPGSYDTTLGATSDIVVSRLDLLPTGVTRIGAGSPGCAGLAHLETSQGPKSPGTSFAVRCVNGARNALGLLIASPAPLGTPQPAVGVNLWVSLTGASFFPIFSDANGTVHVSLPSPHGTAGDSGAMQILFLDPCGPAGVSATDALAITIQS